MTGPESAFVFAACQPGSEAAARDELARVSGGRVAFSRPGLVTVKVDRPVTAGALHLTTTFGRVTGIGAGLLPGPERVAELAGAGFFDGTPHLFVFDRALSGDERAPSALVSETEAMLRSAGSCFAPAGAPLAEGDAVVDVAVAPGEPAYVGRHVHRAVEQIAHPGGRFPLALPPAAPSRAWLKIEEVLAWTGLAPRAGEVALDVGAAPGGASLALLDRGLEVVAIDPGEMDPALLARPRLRHVKAPVGALKRGDLPRDAAWILCDMNLAPRITLRYVERLQGPLRLGIRGMVLTLKMVDARALAELPRYVERVTSWGYRHVATKQLACHRNEVALIATP